MVRALLLTLVILAAALLAPPARAIDLVIWEPGPGFPKFVLPAVPGDTAEESVRRYVRALNTHPELANYGSNKRLRLPTGTARIVDRMPPPPPGKRSLAIFANCVEHLYLRSRGTLDQREMKLMIDQFAGEGIESYVIPLVAEAGMPPSAELKREFRAKARDFDAIFFPGDSKVPDPKLYSGNRATVDPWHLVPESDRWRVEMINEYIDSKRGICFGYCGGYELLAVSQGAKLDTTENLGLGETHRNTEHEVSIRKGSTMHALMGTTHAEVNSEHGWVVTGISPDLPIEATVLSTGYPTNVVEAIEGKQGRLIGVQFHPEYMENETGRRFVSGIARYIAAYQEVRRRGAPPDSCLRLVIQSLM